MILDTIPSEMTVFPDEYSTMRLVVWLMCPASIARMSIFSAETLSAIYALVDGYFAHPGAT